MRKAFILLGFILMVLLANCGKNQWDTLEAEAGEEFSGGTGTIFSFSANAFGFQHPHLNDTQSLFFFTGNSLFNQNWVAAPASTTARDGLGPLFNARSCSGCHFKDGRGRPPEFYGEKMSGLLFRVGSENDPKYGPVADPQYGTQLQDLSILGVPADGQMKVTYELIEGKYPDGSSYSLRKPINSIGELAHGPLETSISSRVANQMCGLGLLEAIPEETLLSFADEGDADQDGISGRPNYVWNTEKQKASIGRFGWKANNHSIEQQVAAAFLHDMGITSPMFPENQCPPSVDCDSMPNGGEPEIPQKNFDKVVLYSSTLAVPGRRNWKDKEVLMGKALFVQAKCSSCHIPKMKTGVHPKIEALSHQTIRPYTDLLLHDMGEGLADNKQDFLATGQEWRTPPLWGIGLFRIVNGHTFYLHDGRARNLEEAILWHGGEAQKSKEAFMNYAKSERDLLIKFLNSL